jgi:regulator of sigma E protease
MDYLFILLALIGLGFLIFIHELGHYIVARRAGMKVEAFGIGFGKPIYSWEHDGVQWNICWLPFGGYVKIAGVEPAADGTSPYDIKDGFFGRGPWAMVKVAFAGPFVNIAFAFLLFTCLWMFGGREKNTADFTPTIGWIDEQSELYQKGIRPGDIITTYDGHPYEGLQDHTFAAMLTDGLVRVQGFKVDQISGSRIPFDYQVNAYNHPYAINQDIKTLGVMEPANYFVYNRRSNGNENPILHGSPMESSGIQYGDRILWVDGEKIYSSSHLTYVLNDERALLTVQRGKDVFLARVPRNEIREIKFDSLHYEELSDWQYEASLKEGKLNNLYFIPYDLDSNCVVESAVGLVDSQLDGEAFPKIPLSSQYASLQKGDKIIAVDGNPVKRSFDLLNRIQSRQVHVVVDRSADALKSLDWMEDDLSMNDQDLYADLTAMTKTIGTNKPLRSLGDLVMLNPVAPKPVFEAGLSVEQEKVIKKRMERQLVQIDKITDPEQLAMAMEIYVKNEKRQILNINLEDRSLNYNPTPNIMFVDVVQQVWRTLTSLLSGNLSPKFLAGPIGIVNILKADMEYGIDWVDSLKSAVYKLGMISLNLGMLNLLPVPILDGGYIVLGSFEMLTKRRFAFKVMETLAVPFAIAFIGLFLFISFYDFIRFLLPSITQMLS